MSQSSRQEDSVPVPSQDKSENPVVCVFCGSSSGTSPSHIRAANALAHTFHKYGVKLVYGGGTGGLMGEIARTLVSLSGPDSVQGIIPEALIQYEQGTKPGEPLIDKAVYGHVTVVPDMHTRKKLMNAKVMEGGPGSGFVALSGGYGTMEELMEVTTWNQLGIHDKGVVIFNVDGYYNGLIEWIKSAVTAGFISPSNGGILAEALDPEEVFTQLRDYHIAEGRLKLNWALK